MTTVELTDEIMEMLKINSITDKNKAYLRLLEFLANRTNGYGVREGPRGDARAYAARNNYFWLPCVICGEWRSGHERGQILNLTQHQGVVTCPNEACQAEARRLREAYPNGISNGLRDLL